MNQCIDNMLKLIADNENSININDYQYVNSFENIFSTDKAIVISAFESSQEQYISGNETIILTMMITVVRSRNKAIECKTDAVRIRALLKKRPVINFLLA